MSTSNSEPLPTEERANTEENRLTDAELDEAIEAFQQAMDAEPLADAMGGYLDGDQMALRAMLELRQIRRQRIAAAPEGRS